MSNLRRILFTLFRPALHAYSQPERVGWRGWYSLPIVGTVAFAALDGAVIFKW